MSFYILTFWFAYLSWTTDKISESAVIKAFYQLSVVLNIALCVALLHTLCEFENQSRITFKTGLQIPTSDNNFTGAAILDRETTVARSIFALSNHNHLLCKIYCQNIVLFKY